MQNNKIGVIGDMHMKDDLSYADYIDDRRRYEKRSILEFIVESFRDCSSVVFLGDNFNSKNNSSETNRAFVEFVEKFNDKEVYIISGNHEKKGDGRTAIDFLGEIDKPNWHIYTDPTMGRIGNKEVNFIPYMLNSELGVDNCKGATKELVYKMAMGGDILFAHHSITGTTFNGVKTDDLNEVVLPREELEKRYKLIMAGHIHKPQQYGKVVITGNVFTSEVGEIEKFIFKIDDELNVEKIKVPAREIHKIENPTIEKLSSIPDSAIVKVIITNKAIDLEEIKQHLTRFDATLVIEDYPNTRKKAHLQEGAFDFSLDSLLKLYAEEKGVEFQKLLKGMQIING